MTVRFDTHGPAVSEVELEAFAETVPGQLADDYRRFLVAQNGGEPEPNWWPVEAGPGAAGVRVFLSLGDVADYSSITATRETFQGRLPDNLLAIAYDEGGGLACLAIDGDAPGSIWFYDPEFEFDSESGPVPFLAVRMCMKFTELLDILEPVPELDEMERRVAAAKR